MSVPDLERMAQEIITGAGTASVSYSQPAPVTVNATTTTILNANAARNFAVIQNDGASDIYLGIGNAAILNRGIRINANGGSYTMSKALGNLSTGAINGIVASGTGSALPNEG